MVTTCLKASDSRVPVKEEERFYKMIMDKYAQVDRLLEEHKDPNDSLQLRLNFVECTANHKLGEMLRRNSNSNGHALSVIADLKRRTPTHHPNSDGTVLTYIDAPEVAKNMASIGFDVIFVNTDETVYGGHISELHECFLELRKLGRRTRPAIVMKDIFLHPIQIAQAAEYRADGVLLSAAILGNALKEMLAACVTMGIEAIVEVHTGTEAMMAIDVGATHLLVNQWDRVANVLRPTRALEIKEMVGDDATLIAAGGIIKFSQIHELGLIGYDAVVLGRRLVYNDIPEFVKQVRDWRAPCKAVLRMSKALFFDIRYDEKKASCEIKLKRGHDKLFKEMNAFYRNESVDVFKIIENDQEFLDSGGSQLEQGAPQVDENRDANLGESDKVVTITCGNPVNTCFVKNILSTVECPESMIDANLYLKERKLDMYQMKWYIEREKWVKRFRQYFKNRHDAYKAHRLQKAIEMYTKFKLLGEERMRKKRSKGEVEQMERTLREGLNIAYKEAPRDEHGNVILPQ
ncbi:Indole-3-glycerol phosphate synthase [Babesia sp. Xinjiang]|uniref:Indole-3-glycerol phosphate synthase n=1 Tax=Babesia sp. Xinjiang TaxID=462227 RepID=UPI000A21683C|nr:Indole-3-glycerol phosphate synthase [Babesia sp. Xinjiang]ORM40827.1 Indole-3-glycerol phosphate synthase [Babesia sp. Xinjiang]